MTHPTRLRFQGEKSLARAIAHAAVVSQYLLDFDEAALTVADVRRHLFIDATSALAFPSALDFSAESIR